MNELILSKLAKEYQAAKMKSLGNVLKFLRLSSGYSQQELADELLTCRQHIQKWEHNICRPNPKRLKQIVNLCSEHFVDFSELIKEFYI